MAEQTAVDWLFEQIPVEWTSTRYAFDAYQQAKQMEKEQMDKVSEDWWNEAMHHTNGGETRYESFIEYYNQTFGK